MTGTDIDKRSLYEELALAADGKRIRGANRNGTLRYETATLVEHSTGVPLASPTFTTATANWRRSGRCWT